MTTITHESLARAQQAPGTALLLPTPQQRAVIEAPTVPSLVVAGAGSGKTQTMVQRMLWLVAQGQARPSELLGLTFTRKAARELRERLEQGLGRLRLAGLAEDDPAELPEVLTYNAFANRVFQEHGVLVGREPDAQLLDEAAAFSIMRRIVLRSADERLADDPASVATVTRRVLGLARALRENEVGSGRLQELHRQIAGWLQLPGRKSAGQLRNLAAVEQAVTAVASLEVYAELADAYEQHKLDHALVEFADQVAAAHEICRAAPQVAASLRERHRHVILDEYQDTSVGQTRFLAELFRGHSLMAVGDPKQSIYGWRGASAANMRRFHRDFGAAEPATFTLDTSWRNDRIILDCANLLAAPLNAAEAGQTLPELRPRPAAPDGALALRFTETLDEETAAVADWFAQRLLPLAADPAERPTAAVLLRARAHLELFADSLRRRGVPVRVLGIGGLMSSPEIVDLVAILRAAHEPHAGSEIIRLLVGARFQLGVAEVAALHELARQLARGTGPRPGGTSDADEEASLAEALAFVETAPEEHRLLGGLAPQARSRLREAAQLLSQVRQLFGLPLVELVEAVIAHARLDIEAAANPHRPEASGNLDVFLDHIVAFTAAQPGAGLGTLLDWLEVAADDDSLDTAGTDPEPGAVQLLTIHAAKGLEWDLVAVPRLVDGGLPATAREGTGWLKPGVLPYPLRLDADDLPRLAVTGHDDQSAVKRAIERLKDEVKQRFLAEERRLAYVATTRARHELLLSGSYWTPGTATARTPSPFLAELVQAGLIPSPPEPRHQEPPTALHSRPLSWPRPAIRDGDRQAMQALAQAVREQQAAPDSSPWDADIALLLREREQQRAPQAVALPERLAASHFHELVTAPEHIAAQLRRPMPRRPHRQTRLGTMFHTWVEQRYGAQGGRPELLDAQEWELEEWELALLGLEQASSEDERRLAELQQRFERTRWAGRTPIAVEQTIELPLGEHSVVCKIDAVFDGPEGTIEVVDWKTGLPPRGPAAEWERQLQLALYTLAYSEHHGVPAERIRPVLVYLADGDHGSEYRFDRVSGRDELLQLLRAAREQIARTAPDARPPAAAPAPE